MRAVRAWENVWLDRAARQHLHRQIVVVVVHDHHRLLGTRPREEHYSLCRVMDFPMSEQTLVASQQRKCVEGRAAVATVKRRSIKY